MGIMLISTVQNIGEMAIMYPVTGESLSACFECRLTVSIGGFYTLVSRFIDPAWGFAMGWNYVAQWAVVLPLELTAAAFTLQFWDPNGTVNIAVWITIFFVVSVILGRSPSKIAV